MSADPCGCDKEAGRVCADHRLEQHHELVLSTLLEAFEKWDLVDEIHDIIIKEMRRIEP